MENVEVKKPEATEVKKEEAKKAPVKKQKKDANKVKFMEHCNKRRAAAKLPAAYSEEEIKAYK